jgi:formylglycine-generating enzyme required for sulfatase activity
VYLDGRSAEQRQRDVLFASELAEDAGWYRLESGGAMFKRLRGDLAEALVPVVEGTTLPAAERVQAGVYLGWLGDPRPGVCTLPPDMVRIEGGEFVIGILPEEEEAYFQAFKRDYPDVDEDELRNLTRAQINDQPLTLPSFEIARYPLTNAQYKLFIDDGGYDPDQMWWNGAGRAWLLRDVDAAEGLASYQWRDYKQHPEWWHHERFGIARPNHPVVGISWYETVAFCRWLSQQTGAHYYLPSEAEWEYAARRATRRTYPWGNEEPDAERANFDETYNGIGAVGCFPAGATPEDGIYDLAGNVWEWTRSAYRSYPYEPADGREDMDNPANKTFVLRGGCWIDRLHLLSASLRGSHAPDRYSRGIGCRLARRLPEA